MAYSVEFATLVAAMTSGESDASIGRKIGVSGTYANNIRSKGIVPTLEVVQKIAETYADSDESSTELMRIAAEARRKDNPERLLIAACDAAGYDMMQRAAVMMAFREQSDKKEATSAA